MKWNIFTLVKIFIILQGFQVTCGKKCKEEMLGAYKLPNTGDKIHQYNQGVKVLKIK